MTISAEIQHFALKMDPGLRRDDGYSGCERTQPTTRPSSSRRKPGSIFACHARNVASRPPISVANFCQSVLLVGIFVASHPALAQNEKVWIPGWKTTTAMSAPRAGAAVVENNGVIYVFGGIDGKTFLNNGEFARIEKDGSLSAWQLLPTMNEARGFFDGIVYRNHVYAVGGGNGPAGHNLLRSVERAEIKSDGSLAPWAQEKQTLNLPRRCVKLFIVGDRMYASGGFGGTLLDSLESAPIQTDGSLGPWQIEKNTHSAPRYVHAAKSIGNVALAVGGHNEKEGVGLPLVEIAHIENNNLGNWQVSTPLHQGRYGLSLAHYGDFVYALGGLGGADFLRSVEKAKLNVDGTIKSWENTNPLSSARANFGVVITKENIYIIGGTNQVGYFNSVDVAGFNARGDFGFWGTKQEGKAYEHEQGRSPIAISKFTTDNVGTVAEVINADRYVYLRITSEKGEEWIAAAAAAFSVGQKISFSDGVMMSNFQSKTLNRTFENIRFVSSAVPIVEK